MPSFRPHRRGHSPRGRTSAGIAALVLAAVLPSGASRPRHWHDARSDRPGRMVPLYAGARSDYTPIRATSRRGRWRRTTPTTALTQTSTIQVTLHGFSTQRRPRSRQPSTCGSRSSFPTRSSTSTRRGRTWVRQAGSWARPVPTNNTAANDGFWYPAALAEARAQCEVNSGAEIEADFNSAFPDWYLGTDGNVPNSDWDLETVVLHELGHGLGFFSSFCVSGTPRAIRQHRARTALRRQRMGRRRPAATLMTTYANGVISAGGAADRRQRLPGRRARRGGAGQAGQALRPVAWQPGSSNSHLDESEVPARHRQRPDDARAQQRRVDPRSGAATKAIFQDIGWTIAGGSNPGDTTPPTVDQPKVNIVAPQTMGSKVSVHVSWPAASDESGIASYELQRQEGAGPWLAVALATPTSRSAQVAVTRGSNTAFRVRATDGADNVGAWTSTPTASMTTVQETSGSIAYSGSWTHSALSGSAGGSVDQSSVDERHGHVHVHGNERRPGHISVRGARHCPDNAGRH